ncbi:membrane-associated protein, putative, partial [Bodo saltans]
MSTWHTAALLPNLSLSLFLFSCCYSMKRDNRKPPRPNRLLPLGNAPGRTTPSPSQVGSSTSVSPAFMTAHTTTAATFRISTPFFFLAKEFASYHPDLHKILR